MTFNDWKIKQKQLFYNEYAFYNLLIFKLLQNKGNFVYHLVEADYHTFIAIALVGEFS